MPLTSSLDFRPDIPLALYLPSVLIQTLISRLLVASAKKVRQLTQRSDKCENSQPRNPEHAAVDSNSTTSTDNIEIELESSTKRKWKRPSVKQMLTYFKTIK